MDRYIVILAALLAVGLWGCQSETPSDADRAGDALTRDARADASPSVRFMATIPPVGMILRPVVEGRAQVDVLLGPGDSPHTYDPRPSDVQAVSGSLRLVHVHEHLDGWVTALPAERLTLAPMVPATRRQAMPSGRRDHESPRGRSPRDDETQAEGAGETGEATAMMDPHFWSDPLAVEAMLPALVDALCSADAEGCPTYQANADTFATDLQMLDSELATMLHPLADTKVALSQPFFQYFLARYGLRVIDIVEPLPAKELSPRQVSRQIETLQTDGARILFTQAQLPDRSARAVAEGAGIPILVLDPIGGVEGRSTYPDLLLYNARRMLAELEHAPPPDTSLSNASPPDASGEPRSD
jgi:ABC-type Zn uptake system ZnuABC Zn-binding protein ZnuA